jgi:serine protease AprX
LNSTVAESYQTSPIDAAVEILWNAGIVVVVSAGNSGPGILFPPANDPFVITVGATDDMGTPNINDDVMASFSTYGTTEDGFAKPDLVAPGRNILSLLASTDATIYNDHPANRVDAYMFRMSGTSMAAPMVSGAVALLLQNEPTLNPDQVKYRLLATANKDWNGYSATTAGEGYLDAYAAVETNTTAAANTGIQLSQLLSNNGNPIVWDSVGWESVGWESVGWESVGWESVGWESVGWECGIWDQ